MIVLPKTPDDYVHMVTPAGTRKAVTKWKTGFYHIALGAGVPIVVGFLDYKKKEAGIGPHIFPDGNMDEQIEELKVFGRSVTGRHPEKGIT